MIIKRYLIDCKTIQQFAEENNLVMIIRERGLSLRNDGLCNFYAYFENVDVKDGCGLISEFGNGNNEKEAILDYAKKISDKLLVIDPFQKRKEIRVPLLYV
jgi:hypothetical protein